MIKNKSDDPDVELAAKEALQIIEDTLAKLPKAEDYDYGGHYLHLGEYDVCSICTSPIAEAQQAEKALREKAEEIDSATVKEHLNLAAQLIHLEAEAAIVRAEFHNGLGTEKILNYVLGFFYERKIQEDFHHSHHQGD